MVQKFENPQSISSSSSKAHHFIQSQHELLDIENHNMNEQNYLLYNTMNESLSIDSPQMISTTPSSRSFPKNHIFSNITVASCVHNDSKGHESKFDFSPNPSDNMLVLDIIANSIAGISLDRFDENTKGSYSNDMHNLIKDIRMLTLHYPSFLQKCDKDILQSLSNTLITLDKLPSKVEESQEKSEENTFVSLSELDQIRQDYHQTYQLLEEKYNQLHASQLQLTEELTQWKLLTEEKEKTISELTNEKSLLSEEIISLKQQPSSPRSPLPSPSFENNMIINPFKTDNDLTSKALTKIHGIQNHIKDQKKRKRDVEESSSMLLEKIQLLEKERDELKEEIHRMKEEHDSLDQSSGSLSGLGISSSGVDLTKEKIHHIQLLFKDRISKSLVKIKSLENQILNKNQLFDNLSLQVNFLENNLKRANHHLIKILGSSTVSKQLKSRPSIYYEDIEDKYQKIVNSVQMSLQLMIQSYSNLQKEMETIKLSEKTSSQSTQSAQAVVTSNTTSIPSTIPLPTTTNITGEIYEIYTQEIKIQLEKKCKKILDEVNQNMKSIDIQLKESLQEIQIQYHPTNISHPSNTNIATASSSSSKSFVASTSFTSPSQLNTSNVSFTSPSSSSTDKLRQLVQRFTLLTKENENYDYENKTLYQISYILLLELKQFLPENCLEYAQLLLHIEQLVTLANDNTLQSHGFHKYLQLFTQSLPILLSTSSAMDVSMISSASQNTHKPSKSSKEIQNISLMDQYFTQKNIIVNKQKQKIYELEGKLLTLQQLTISSSSSTTTNSETSSVYFDTTTAISNQLTQPNVLYLQGQIDALQGQLTQQHRYNNKLLKTIHQIFFHYKDLEYKEFITRAEILKSRDLISNLLSKQPNNSPSSSSSSSDDSDWVNSNLWNTSPIKILDLGIQNTPLVRKFQSQPVNESEIIIPAAANQLKSIFKSCFFSENVTEIQSSCQSLCKLLDFSEIDCQNISNIMIKLAPMISAYRKFDHTSEEIHLTMKSFDKSDDSLTNSF